MDANANQGFASDRTKHDRISHVKQIRIWDGNQLQALLSVHESVRRSVPGFLTGPDVFAALTQFSDRVPIDELEPVLRTHARRTLLGEGSIYFDEAGGDPKGVPIHEVAVDLPTTDASGNRGTFVGTVLDRAEHVLTPSLTTLRGPRHLIVTGAPGNGKSTISKFLVQAYRAALVSGGTDLSAEHRNAIQGVEDALARLGRPLPLHRRWPMRIDLAEYAQEGDVTEDATLLRWIALKVSRRSDDGQLTPSLLKSWMRTWPWLLVLDGLDEVTEPMTRRRLITQVVELVNEAEALDCDVLVVLTTRPIGYTEDIAPSHFERVDLDYLQPDEAVRFGTLATRVRLGADDDRIDRVVRHLKQSAADEALRHLLRTPLQVLILTIIVDTSGQLAPDRFRLFWGYYEAVFRRETAKSGWLQHLLRDYQQQIQVLHERVGFELQVRSESAEHSMATLTADELKQLTWQVLAEAGFDPSGRDAELQERFFNASTQRLVLVVPRGDDGYGFDVRSLQELMAGKYLTSGTLDNSVGRLRRAVASPHWRNTWLFAAGSLFSEPRDYQQEALVDLVERGDQDASERLGLVAPVTPRLALEVLDDGMARSIPKFRDRLARHGLRILSEPAGSDLPALVRILIHFADGGDAEQSMVAEALRQALSGSEASRQTALSFMALVGPLADEVAAASRVRGLATIPAPMNELTGGDTADWDSFEADLETFPGELIARERLASAGGALRQIAKHWDAPVTGGEIENAVEREADEVVAALSDPETARELEAALCLLIQSDPVVQAIIRDLVLTPVLRQPIGAGLRDAPSSLPSVQ